MGHNVHIAGVYTYGAFAKAHIKAFKPQHGILNGVEVVFKYPSFTLDIFFHTCLGGIRALRSFAVKKEKQENQSDGKSA